MPSPAPRTWLLMAAGDDRGHGGNDGYDDQIDAYYSWDSNVPNSRALSAGAPVAVWDKQRLLGVSVIEEIDSWPGSKVVHRCPSCRTTRISARARKLPTYRCMKAECHHEFDHPLVDAVEVTHYRARYDAAWTSLDGVLDAAAIRGLAVHKGDFNAMRPIDWNALESALRAHHADRAVQRVAGRVPHFDAFAPPPGTVVGAAHGHRQALVRVRRGQGNFRAHLLAEQGQICAFTGAAPARVLEAGHLYSYAQLGEHHPHGGLMLRRDIHRLFDDGLLAIEPAAHRIDVAPELEPYAQYARLHDTRLSVPLRDEQAEWLGKHWIEHRGSPSRGWRDSPLPHAGVPDVL